MGRTARLIPRYDRRAKRWILSIPSALSPTGKRRQERFTSKEAAEGRAETLRLLRAQHDEAFAKHLRPELVRDALECEEMASELGFDSLRHAFMSMAADWERRQKTMTLGALLDAYETDRKSNWSERYRKNRWRPFRKRIEALNSTAIGTMDSDFWRKWLAEFRRKSSPAAATYNQMLGMLRAVFAHEKAAAILSRNPLHPLPNLRLPAKTIAVFEPREVAALLNWCWKYDPEMLPYFAIGCFAGLRPGSELGILRFEHIDLDERLIDVHTTKTVHSTPGRQVFIEENLAGWLAPFARKLGAVVPGTNFRRRFDAARSGAAQALGIESFPWSDDIMRHSYGSYWDAAHRGEEGAVDQLVYRMGHSSRKTFERYYHNHRSRKEATAYWSITPPRDIRITSIA